MFTYCFRTLLLGIFLFLRHCLTYAMQHAQFCWVNETEEVACTYRFKLGWGYLKVETALNTDS